MPSVSTVPEALASLSELTARQWTESELFDVAKCFSIELHAAVPRSARTIVLEMQDWSLVQKCDLGTNHTTLVVLFPFQVGQLADRGDTEASHPHDHDRMEGQHKLLTEPAHVTRDNVRVRAVSLKAILNKWKAVQSGAVHPATCPHWMLSVESAFARPPTTTPAPAPTHTATHPAPAAESGALVAARTGADEKQEEWMSKSVELANAIGLRKWEAGERQITARKICNSVATELAKGEPEEPQKYHGTQGPRAAHAIRSKALAGWKFAYPSGTSGTNGTD